MARGGGSAIRASDPGSSRPLAAGRRHAPVSTAERGSATDRRHESAPADDAARLGNPSFVWRFGQERRLAILSRFVSLRGALVLDLGCGVGEYVRAFQREGARAVGLDIEPQRLAEARRRLAAGGGGAPAALVAAAGERLPLRDGCLDAAVLNEVIEHVADDAATLREVRRVLKPGGGTCVIFAPNRLYPFETHGVYIGRRYVFGNIPLVNWLPDGGRGAPPSRTPAPTGTATGSGWPVRPGLRFVHHGYVYPGFDNAAARWPRLASILRAICYRAEGTPAARLGLSHLVVLRRGDGAGAGAPEGGAA